MIWLSGGHPASVIGLDVNLGVMLTPQMGNLLPLERCWWAYDHGTFLRPETWDAERHLASLRRLRAFRATCLFATAPDVLGNPAATLERSLPVLPSIRQAGVRAALVAQDGLEALPVPWDAFDCLFVGGSPTWKMSPAADGLAAEARDRGKWVHLGGLNSARRVRVVASKGLYDSADGTFLKFAPDQNLVRLRRWLTHLRQISLEALS